MYCSWALATAYSRLAYDSGDPVKGAQLADKARGHHLTAIAIAEREAVARPKSAPKWRALVDATPDEEPTE